MSGKTAVGSSGVPFHRLAKPEGNKPTGHALFYFLKESVVKLYFFFKYMVPFQIIPLVLSKNSPAK